MIGYIDRKHFEMVWPCYSAKCLHNYYLEHSLPLLSSLEILTHCSALKILSHCGVVVLLNPNDLVAAVTLENEAFYCLHSSLSLLPKWHVYQSWSIVNNHSSFPKLSFDGNFLRRQCVLASAPPPRIRLDDSFLLRSLLVYPWSRNWTTCWSPCCISQC